MPRRTTQGHAKVGGFPVVPTGKSKQGKQALASLNKLRGSGGEGLSPLGWCLALG